MCDSCGIEPLHGEECCKRLQVVASPWCLKSVLDVGCFFRHHKRAVLEDREFHGGIPRGV